jgi:hypothetical protein
MASFSGFTENARYRDFPVRCVVRCSGELLLLSRSSNPPIDPTVVRLSSRRKAHAFGYPIKPDRESGVAATPGWPTRIDRRLLVRASGLRLFEPSPQVAGEFGHQLQFAGEFGRQLRFRQR